MSDILQNLKDDVFKTMNCINIGVIQSFDESDQTATIRLALKRVLSISEDGTREIQERPILVKCPVVTLFGGATFISFPISKGDECLVLFNDREIDNWWHTGAISTPTSPRTHDISDGIALVGVRSLQNSIQNYLTNGIRLSHSIAKIDITQDQIDTVASLFVHTGDLRVTQDLRIEGGTEFVGNVTGDSGGVINLGSDLTQQSGKVLKAGNGATGSFTSVTVADGIVTGGT